MPELQPHQERVIDERNGVQIKIDRLGAFLRSESVNILPADEQERMKRQLNVMGQYRDVLNERIAAFHT